MGPTGSPRLRRRPARGRAGRAARLGRDTHHDRVAAALRGALRCHHGLGTDPDAVARTSGAPGTKVTVTGQAILVQDRLQLTWDGAARRHADGVDERPRRLPSLVQGPDRRRVGTAHLRRRTGARYDPPLDTSRHTDGDCELRPHPGQYPHSGQGGLRRDSSRQRNAHRHGDANRAAHAQAQPDGSPADGSPTDRSPADGSPTDRSPAGHPATADRSASADRSSADRSSADGSSADGSPAGTRRRSEHGAGHDRRDVRQQRQLGAQRLDREPARWQHPDVSVGLLLPAWRR